MLMYKQLLTFSRKDCMKIKKVDSIVGHQGFLRFSNLAKGDSFRWLDNPDCLCIKVWSCCGGIDGYVSLDCGTHWTSKDSGNIRENREVEKVVSEIQYI